MSAPPKAGCAPAERQSPTDSSGIPVRDAKPAPCSTARAGNKPRCVCKHTHTLIGTDRFRQPEELLRQTSLPMSPPALLLRRGGTRFSGTDKFGYGKELTGQPPRLEDSGRILFRYAQADVFGSPDFRLREQFLLRFLGRSKNDGDHPGYGFGLLRGF